MDIEDREWELPEKDHEGEDDWGEGERRMRTIREEVGESTWQTWTVGARLAIGSLEQDKTALTTANANLAALVAEMRAALEKALKLLHGVKEFPHDLTIYGPGGINVERVRSVSAQLSAILARSPEQAGERRRALEEAARCAAWWVAASDRYYDQKTAGWESEDQTRVLANEMVRAEEATEAAVVALAALEVKDAESGG